MWHLPAPLTATSKLHMAFVQAGGAALLSFTPARKCTLCARVRAARVRTPAMAYGAEEEPAEETEAAYSFDGEEGAVDVDAFDVDADVSLEDLKMELYAAAAACNRGFVASPRQKEALLATVRRLEKCNPTAAPMESETLVGTWKLLFTNALDVLSLGLLSPVALVGQVFQNIAESETSGTFSVENIVELESPLAPVTNAFFGQTMASLKVSATGLTVSPTRLDITFTQGALRAVVFAGREFPESLPALTLSLMSPVGYIETSYLDSDMRIARAPPVPNQEENVFVLVRERK